MLKPSENIIPDYLKAVESILANFRFNRPPSTEDSNIVLFHTHEFTSALRGMYLSNDGEKQNKYEIIYEVLSEANIYICKENFGPGVYNDFWRGIIFNLETACSYIRELHFRETNRYFPFPPKGNQEDHLYNSTSEKTDVFSALEWATIFYYANDLNVNLKAKTLKEGITNFINKNKVGTTYENFRTKYYSAKRRINSKNDYPINKLKKIKPFIETNFKEALIKLENDIVYLSEEQKEY